MLTSRINRKKEFFRDKKKVLLRFIRLVNISSLFTLYSSRHSTYHLTTFIIPTYLNLAVSRTCVTHKNLVYDLAHHESPIVQWFIERPTGIWKVMGSTPVGARKNSFIRFVRLVNISSLFTLYPSRHSTYHLRKDRSSLFSKIAVEQQRKRYKRYS